MKITFYGGTGSVTGANYLLEINSKNGSKVKILVDCGLKQGGRYAEKENFEPFPFEPKEIKYVFITHSHLDHIGRLPKLLKEGFAGKIYSTPPTKDFAEVMLIDSEHILLEEAEREKKPPLYELGDIELVKSLWQTADYRKPIDFGDFKVTFFDAGHILGSAFIFIEAEGKEIVFSGDLGNSPAVLIGKTDPIPETDYCLIESTYGDRLHEAQEEREGLLEDAIESAAKNGGTLLIPAFALERTQELLLHINDLIENQKIPKIPVFIDSPLAIKLIEVYRKYKNYYNPQATALLKSEGDFLNFAGLHLTLTTEESKKINDFPPPKVVIAGSGMSQGGRILHHEIRYLPDPKSLILFIGYQAENSLGRQILDGAESVKIFGETVPVRCQKKMISGYSAHADQAGLLDWLWPIRQVLKNVFVVQGEKKSSEVLAQKIKDDLAVEAIIPKFGQSFDL